MGELWKAYTALSDDLRRRFLQAANPYKHALSLGNDQRTLGFALLVVACEALKPPGPRYNGHNIYGVVRALLGEECAQQLLSKSLQPQKTRNAHFHRGEFQAGEFTRIVFLASYRDPSFDDRCRVLRVITPAAIVEWLRRGGAYVLPVRPFSERFRWDWKMVVGVTTCATLLLLAGTALGWFLKS